MDGYFGHAARLPFVPHGWIVTNEDEVVDPTRWVFENVEPYIFVGIDDHADFTSCANCGHIGDEHARNFLQECLCCDCPCYERTPWPYDEGGNAWRRANMKPPPPPVGKRVCVLTLHTLARLHVQKLLRDTHDAFTQAQLFWLANLPYDILQPHAAAIYAAYENVSLQALIPIDNRLRAEREAP